MGSFAYPDWCNTCAAYVEHIAATSTNDAPVFPVRCATCGRTDTGRITPA